MKTFQIKSRSFFTEMHVTMSFLDVLMLIIQDCTRAFQRWNSKVAKVTKKEEEKAFRRKVSTFVCIFLLLQMPVLTVCCCQSLWWLLICLLHHLQARKWFQVDGRMAAKIRPSLLNRQFPISVQLIVFKKFWLTCIYLIKISMLASCICITEVTYAHIHGLKEINLSLCSSWMRGGLQRWMQPPCAPTASKGNIAQFNGCVCPAQERELGMAPMLQ